jgi:N-methylhydantoinase A
MSYTVAVDSGGTFTDCVAVDEAGIVVHAKAPSTPPDFERGVLAAVGEVARRLDRTVGELLADTTVFAHGTTVATNTLVTRTGARVALLTTKGHEDAILIGRTVQKVAGLSEDEIIDVARLRKAEPLVPRGSILGVDERIDRWGEVVAPLDTDNLVEIGERLLASGFDAIAVSLLWSFLNPEHEQRLSEWLEQLGKADGNGGARWFVTSSHELAPVMREYERTSTTVLNAYLTPGVNGYLGRMRDQLRDHGNSGAIAVMHSAGGVSSIEEASRRGVSLLSSGPAGGMLGAQALAQRLGIENAIATDVGGTSFDVGLVVAGEPAYAEDPVFAKYPVVLPVIDVASIGAGGGSIGWVEPDTGVLRVGPESAGASPGPACYGAGGDKPTVTDANVVLGRINPDNFLGGRMRLDRDRAVAAVELIATQLGGAVEDTAVAMIEIADAQMADLIRRVTVQRGHDPAGFAVFAYGGAAGLHADAYAGKLSCREVVIPAVASVFSAFGIAASDGKRVEMVSDPALEPFDLTRWKWRFEELERKLRDDFEHERLPADQLAVRRFADLQFRGQVHTVRVPIELDDLDLDDGGEAVIVRFIERYENQYGAGTSYRQAGVEVMTLAIEGIAAMPGAARRWQQTRRPMDGRPAQIERDVQLGDSQGPTRVPVRQAESLGPGDALTGPAIIEAEDTTVLLHPGHRLWLDELANMRIDFG